MSKCNNCNCVCHCSLTEHSDTYGVCPCIACACNSNTIDNETDAGLVIDDTRECESCQ